LYDTEIHKIQQTQLMRKWISMILMRWWKLF